MTHTDDVIADELHQLADDGVEHARVGHNAEIQNGEYEQGCGGGGGVESGFDHGCQVLKAEPAAQYQDQAQNAGEDDKGDGGLGLALEQGDDDRHDGENTENANYGVAHGGYLFLFNFILCLSAFLSCPKNRCLAGA